MKKSRFTTEQIIAVLQEHAAGASPAELMRRHNVSPFSGSTAAQQQR